MVRFIHTADWQFGMKARDVAAKGGDVRQARLDTLARVGRLAGERQAAFVLLAGDVFEDNQVDNQLVYDVLRGLERFPCPAYLLPGNHDCAGPASVYSRPAFASRSANVHVLDEPVAVEAGGAWLLPSPLRHRWSQEDPTEALGGLGPASGAIRIGVAHGSLRIEGKYKADDFPIALNAAARAGLDYLALGHWHSYYAHDVRTVYSGTPEPTKFGEVGGGSVALVEIDAPGAVPRIERVPVATLKWDQWDEVFTADPEACLADWRQRIESLAEPARLLLRLAPRGSAPAEFRPRVEEFAQWARSRLFYVDLRLDALTPALGGADLLAACASHPLLSGLMSDLQALDSLIDPSQAPRLAPGGTPVDHDYLRQRFQELGGDAALAREARYLLAELVQEVTR